MFPNSIEGSHTCLSWPAKRDRPGRPRHVEISYRRDLTCDWILPSINNGGERFEFEFNPQIQDVPYADWLPLGSGQEVTKYNEVIKDITQYFGNEY